MCTFSLLLPTCCICHWEDGKWKNAAGIRTRDHMRVFLARRARPLCYSCCPTQWHCWKKSRCMAPRKIFQVPKNWPIVGLFKQNLAFSKQVTWRRKKERKKFLSFSLLRFLHRFFFPLRSEKLVCKKILVRCFEHKRLFFTSTQNGADDEDVGPMFNCSTCKKFLVLSNKVDSSQSLAWLFFD